MKHLAALVASTALVAAGLAWAGPPQPAYVSAALTSGALVKASGAQSVASGDLSGDCTTSAALVTTCTKTGGVAFGYFATGTDASNLSGTLAAARLPAFTAHAVLLGTGSTGTFGTATIGTSGRVLTDNGAGTDPTFQAPAGGTGTVTSITCNAGLTGGTITTSGTCALDLNHANAFTAKQDLGAAGDVTPSGTSTTGIGYGGSPIDTQAGDYTIVLADIGKTVIETSSSAQTFTIDKNANKAYAAGFLFDVLNTGTGTLTVTATSPATITQEGSGVTGNITVAPHARVKFQQVGTDLWEAIGQPGCAPLAGSPVTTAGSQSSVTFSTIPTGRYMVLRVEGEVSVANNILVQFNADTGSNYTDAFTFSNNSATTQGVLTSQTAALAGVFDSAASFASFAELTIDEPNGTTFFKVGLTRWARFNANTAAGSYIGSASVTWRNAGAITAAKIFPDGGATFTNGDVVSGWMCN